jgi:hypothetical protein
VTEISVEIQKKNPILPYKWLFWWVFNFHLKLRTAIEWDYGILPSSSIKGLPTDTDVQGSRRDHLTKGAISFSRVKNK